MRTVLLSKVNSSSERSMATMRAVEIAEFGGPEGLRLTKRPMPEPGVGEVLVRVTASGVNRPDVLQRMGRYAPPPGASDIPGLEIAGVVECLHPTVNVDWLQVGVRVCALVAGGGYAEYCVVPAAQCLPVPVGLTDVEAASLPETAFTVWSNVFDRAALQAGESILIHGGSSGIGVMAIQLAKAFGAKVFVTVGTADKASACLALGADQAINYRTQDFEAEIGQLTEGRGVNVILDMVAGSYVARNIRCLAEDGRAVLIAVQGGVRAEVDAGLVLRKRLTLTGSTLRPRSVAFKATIAEQLRSRLWPLIERGAIRPVIHSVYSPAAASDAHRMMESGDHVGKLMLDWSLA